MPTVTERPEVVAPAPGVGRAWTAVCEQPDGDGKIETRANLALAPSRMLAALALAGVFPLGVALAFLSVGVPMVLPFAFLECAALGAALFYLARHAGDCETVKVAGRWVSLERRRGATLQTWEFPRSGLNVAFRHGADGGRVRLWHGRRSAELGSHVQAWARPQLARDIDRMVARVAPYHPEPLQKSGLK